MNMHTNLLGEKIRLGRNYKDERLDRQVSTVRAVWIDADGAVRIVAETSDGRFVPSKLGECTSAASCVEAKE